MKIRIKEILIIVISIHSTACLVISSGQMNLEPGNGQAVLGSNGYVLAGGNDIQSFNLAAFHTDRYDKLVEAEFDSNNKATQQIHANAKALGKVHEQNQAPEPATVAIVALGLLLLFQKNKGCHHGSH